MRGTRALSSLMFTIAVLHSVASAEILEARSAQRHGVCGLLDIPSVRAAAERACDSGDARGHSMCAILRRDIEQGTTPTAAARSPNGASVPARAATAGPAEPVPDSGGFGADSQRTARATSALTDRIRTDVSNLLDALGVRAAADILQATHDIKTQLCHIK